MSGYGKPLLCRGTADRIPPGCDRPGALRRQLCAGDGSPHRHGQTTALKLLIELGEFCSIYQDHVLRNLNAQRTEADEIRIPRWREGK